MNFLEEKDALCKKEEPLLEVVNLKTYFPIKSGVFRRTVGYLKAVDDVSFTIAAGETLGLVGESGCGKSTTARSILRLVEPTDGKIFFKGTDVRALKESQLRSLRRHMQIIFQDPYSSLNPRMTVASIVGEGLRIHEKLPWREIRERIAFLLDEVGLSPHHINRYPHEFSGGQRQRIGIARALALNPSLLICDEPVSALDVSIRAQIINLLTDLKERHNFAYLFISHDLSVVEHIADRVAVMYLGKIVEIASSTELYNHPSHPYTVSLLDAIPLPDPKRRRNVTPLKGQVPTLAHLPSGCRFHPRCERKRPICETHQPPLTEVSPSHSVLCHSPIS
ncbi:MAG: ATP-binding cassette domain-containing protein [Planctomycetota bacterium]|nr:ATP-binding cassette domain-containing protein [Planctomycetota bacterium]